MSNWELESAIESMKREEIREQAAREAAKEVDKVRARWEQEPEVWGALLDARDAILRKFGIESDPCKGEK